jgi:Domain of unknown function (DUF4365)
MASRKKRTREHIIADLSENHFEKFAILKGFSVERTAHDYGYDLVLFTYDSSGEIENGYVSVQLKATDNLEFIHSGTIISFTVDKRDLDLWLNEFNPVILVIYDAENFKGYWLYIQAYFQNLQNFTLASVNKTLNVHIPIVNKINKSSMKKFAEQKERLYRQLKNIQHQN